MKAVCRFGAYILAMLLLFSDILPCRAAEIGSGAYPEEGNEEEKEVYTLEADKSQINFGPLEQGSLVTGQEIVLTNSGAGDIWLKWHESDSYDCVSVDAPDDDYLEPEESCTFTVTANTALAPGTYSAFLLFGDADDDSFDNGVQVNISVDIREPAPAITSIKISPETATVSKNSSCAFSAAVTGKNNYSREVAWSVSGQTSGSTFVDGGGILNVGADEGASSLIVKAVSRQDSNYSATALVSLLKESYFIQAKASPENGGVVSGSGSVAEGGYAVLSAAANNGFSFDGWFLSGVKVSSDSRYVADDIHSNRTYVAGFKPVDCRINVSVNNSSAGTATESRSVGYGEGMLLEAAAKDGYQFDGWMENGTIVSTDARMQLNNITGSRSFTAMFSQNRYTLTLVYSPSNTGTVSGQGIYNKGSDVKVTAVPERGYRFAGWSENGKTVSTSQEYTVKGISRDMCLTALFEKEQAKNYTVSAGVSSLNGTITPDGKSTVTEGGGILYTITPKSGYTIKAVYVDGKSVGAVSSYRFTDIKANHNISADFAALPGQGNGSAAAKASPDSSNKGNKPEENKTNKMAGTAEKTDEDKDDVEEEKEDAEKEDAGQQAVEISRLTGTLQYLDIPVEEAERLIDGNNDRELMTGALATGDLQVTIRNEFADREEEASVTNFDAVLSRILTKEEKMEMLLGNAPVAVSFYIDGSDGEEPQMITRTFEENMSGDMKIGQYFEMSLMKTRLDYTHVISELPEKLQIVIKVPENLKAADREFSILRLHANENSGFEYSEIADEDDNPDTITFSTDRFSPYAIAYVDGGAGKTAHKGGGSAAAEAIVYDMAGAIVMIAIIFAAAITVFWVLYLIRNRRG